MDYISLAEYAELHGKEQSTVRQKAIRGGFRTAQKIGRNWVIDRNEPYIDNRKKEVTKMTKYYFLKTNGHNAILVTNGNKSAVFHTDSNGIDPTSGIDLYSENPIDELRTAYAEIDGLYNMNDIEMDFPDKMIPADDPDPEDELILIAETEEAARAASRLPHSPG